MAKAKPAAKKAAAKKATPAPAKKAVKKPSVKKSSVKPAAAPAARKIVPTIAADLPILSIHLSPLNPRHDRGALWESGELEALMESIIAHGVIQPLLVRPMAVPANTPSDQYEIIAGSRRYRAAAKAVADGRLPMDFTLPVRIRDCTDAELVELAATENMGREDMHPLDEAAAIAAMRQYHSDDREIARRLGIPERTFYRRAALLRLAEPIKEDLRTGKVTFAQAAAYSLGAVKDQVDHHEEAAKNEWLRSSDQIRRAMTKKSVPVTRAIFPVLDQYDGAFITDPETGERYFADVTRFTTLQAAAIKARIDDLKAQRYAFVKKVEPWHSPGFAKCAKTATGAGAIYWEDHDGTFHTKFPVLDPDAARKAEAQRKKTSGAMPSMTAVGDDGDGDNGEGGDAADDRREISPQEAALDAQRIKLFNAALDEPTLGLAALTTHQLCTFDYDPEEANFRRSLAIVVPFVRAALGLPDDVPASEIAVDSQDESAVKVFQACRTLSPAELMRIFVATQDGPIVGIIWNHRDEFTPLGEEIAQEAAQ